jgi:hypothetical protein
MAKYFYDKYYVDTVSDGYSYYSSYYRTYTEPSGQISGYTGFSFNSSTGQFSVTGSVIYTSSGTVYTGSGSETMANSISGTTVTQTMYYSYASSHSVRGSFIETIIAEDGMYPNNGINGSYWYVKRSLAYFSKKIIGKNPVKINGCYAMKVLGIQ